MSTVWDQEAKNSSGGFELVPDGNHPAVLVALIDLGTQTQRYQDKVEEAPQIFLVWELVTEKMSGYKDRNHTIGRAYRLSSHQKSGLRQMLEKWRGKAFAEGEAYSLKAILGKPCLLSVVHKTSAQGTAYARIEGVSAVPKGMSVPQPQHKPFLWAIGDGVPPTFDWIPYLFGESVETVVKRSKEYLSTPLNGGQQVQPVASGHQINPDADEAPF